MVPGTGLKAELKLSLFLQMELSKVNAVILTRKSNSYSTRLNSDVYTCIDLGVTLLMSAVYKYIKVTVTSMAHIQIIQKSSKKS